MRFLPGSRTVKIVDMAKGGWAVHAIAAELKCTKNTVYKAIRRYDQREPPRPSKAMKISALTPDEAYWLKDEARRIGVPWPDLARAMLTDAINEARDGH